MTPPLPPKLGSGRRWLVLSITAVLVGLTVRVSALGASFAFDDFAQKAMLDGAWPVRTSPLDLYAFVRDRPEEHRALLDAGAIPWWSHPHLELSALRPLSSALLWFDEHALGGGAFAAHLHSLAWWLALLAAAALLLHRVLPHRIAAIALFVYALDEAHTMPLAWIANRCAIVSSALGLFGVSAYVRFRRLGRRGDAALCAAAFVASWLAGEYATGPVCLALAFELVVRRDALRSRLLGALPLVVPAVAYAIAHHLLGYGAGGSGLYADPSVDLGGWLELGAPRVVMLASDALVGVPAEGGPRSFGALVASAAAAIAVVAAVVWRARRLERGARGAVAWIGAGSAAALAPLVASFPSSRLLLVADLGASVAVAVVFASALDAWPLRNWGAISGAAALFAVHLFWAPLRSFVESRSAADGFAGTERALASANYDPRGIDEGRVVLATAADPTTLLYTPIIWHRAGGKAPRSFSVLSAARGAHRVSRTAPDTLEVESLDADMLETPLERLFRAPGAPFHANDVVHLDGVTVTILEVGAHGPRRVRFQLDRRLDDPTVQLFVTTPYGPRRAPAPPMGELVTMGPTPAPYLAAGP